MLGRRGARTSEVNGGGVIINANLNPEISSLISSPGKNQQHTVDDTYVTGHPNVKGAGRDV